MTIFPTVFVGINGENNFLLLIVVAVRNRIVLTPVQQPSHQRDDEHLQDQELLTHHWGKKKRSRKTLQTFSI